MKKPRMESKPARNPSAGRRAPALAAADPVGEIEQAIRESMRAGGCAPQQRILSRRNLARWLRTRESRVQQAIARLEKKGYLRARRGSGVYVTDKVWDANGARAMAPARASASAAAPAPVLPISFFPHVPIFKRLRIEIGGWEDPRQSRMWQRALDAFHRETPFVTLEPCSQFSAPDETCELRIQSIMFLRDAAKSFTLLSADALAKGGMQPERLCDGLLDLGRADGSPELKGIPLLRTTAILVFNHHLFRRHRLNEDEIQTPLDFFRAGSAMEEKSRGRVAGFNYLGCQHFCTFYGIEVRAEGERYRFDRARMARFLAELKPHIRHKHLETVQIVQIETMKQLAENGLGICCTYLYLQPWLVERMGPAVGFLKLPLEPRGFVSESICVGAIPQGAKHAEETMLLISFLASERGQSLLVEQNPEWLSVDRQVLEKQKAVSPFPPGAVVYEFDPRSHYTQVSRRMYHEFVGMANTETAKFFLGLQGLEETLDKLARIGQAPTPGGA
ncbi:MAG: GntR family transcriptional regulator [Verrucomicrobia bacterium]|nr:GntR family transcriptional regulator [Verrucomicrobiota bacterium]